MKTLQEYHIYRLNSTIDSLSFLVKEHQKSGIHTNVFIKELNKKLFALQINIKEFAQEKNGFDPTKN